MSNNIKHIPQEIWGRKLYQSPITNFCMKYHGRLYTQNLARGPSIVLDLALRIVMLIGAIVIYPILAILTLKGPPQPSPILKGRTALLASVNHELFTTAPLVKLIQSYVVKGYLVEIEMYATPNTGNEFRHRYLGIARFSGIKYGLVRKASEHKLHVEFISHIQNISTITDLNGVSLTRGISQVGKGALHRENILLNLTYLHSILVLDGNDQFKSLEGLEFDVENVELVSDY